LKLNLFLKDIINALTFNKIRTAFSLLGIIMGISSLVLIVSSIEGSTLRANKVIKKLGPDSVLILSGSIKSGPRRKMRNLTFKDVKEISKLDGIFALTYGLIKLTTVKSEGNSKFTVVFGVGENWISSWDYKMDMGRDFTKSDFSKFSKVCIIGHDVSDFLFPNENPIGKTITVGKTPLKVIGVYERRGKTPNGHNLDDRIFVPITVYQKVIEPEFKYVTLIRFRVLPSRNYTEIVKETRKILLKTHSPDEFSIITPTVVKRFLSMMSASLSIFLGVASLTALVVGGFVLSSIFYINIYVRKWEIGLRRALGAKRSDIKKRIISESIIICLTGSAIGIAIGFICVKLLLPMLSIPIVYPRKVFLLAPAFSIIVGIAASYSPAKRASEFEPIESLKSKV